MALHLPGNAKQATEFKEKSNGPLHLAMSIKPLDIQAK
jgi:hypothetical protein